MAARKHKPADDCHWEEALGEFQYYKDPTMELSIRDAQIILSHMEQYKTNEEAMGHILVALVKLLAIKNNQLMLEKAGVITWLLVVLKEKTQPALVITALYGLAEDNNNKQAIVDGGGLELIAAAMKSDKFRGVQIQGCKLIGLLAKSDQEVQERLVYAGGIDVLLATFKDTNEEVRLHGVKALAPTCKSQRCKEKILQKKGIPLILKGALKDINNPSIAACCCDALLLLSEDTDVMVAIYNAGGTVVIKAIMKEHRFHEHIQEAGQLILDDLVDLVQWSR